MRLSFTHPCRNETSFWRPRMLMGATLGVQAVVLGQVRPFESNAKSSAKSATGWQAGRVIWHKMLPPALLCMSSYRCCGPPAGAAPCDRRQDVTLPSRSPSSDRCMPSCIATQLPLQEAPRVTGIQTLPHLFQRAVFIRHPTMLFFPAAGAAPGDGHQDAAGAGGR